MATKVYNLYGTTAVDVNALVYWTAPRRGTIKRISWRNKYVTVADNSEQNAELSFGSGWQGTSNDAIGPVDRIVFYLEVGAAGTHMACINHDTMVDLEVLPGDRLYLNVGGTNTTTGFYRILLEVDERGGG